MNRKTERRASWPVRPGTLLLATVLAGVAGASHAQQMYRCGNVYSQTPCGADAVAKRVSSAAPDAGPGLSGQALCMAAARAKLGGTEPESARIELLNDRRSEMIQHAGQPLAAFRYDVAVEAKNQHGMYVARSATCWLSEDQARLLQFRSR